MHKCEYCDTTDIKPCTQPCLDKNDPGHVCCSCGTDILCELPEKVVCSGPACNFKFEQDSWSLRLTDLQTQYNEKLEELKRLSNHGRILGFGPASLELFIRENGLNAAGIFINKGEAFTWDQMSPDDLVTFGLTMLRNYEHLAKNWASFLNEKGVKLQIKKDQLAASNAKIKKSEATRNTKSSDLTKTNEPRIERIKVILSKYEQLVVKNCKVLQLDQANCESYLHSMGIQGEARDLKQLGQI